MEETKQNPETELLDSMKNKEDNNSTDDQLSPRSVLEISLSGSDSERSNTSTISSCGSVVSSEKSVCDGGDGDVSGESSSSSGSAASSEKLAGGVSGGLHWRRLIDHIKRKSVRRLKTGSRYELSSKSLRNKFGSNRSADDEIDCGGEMMEMMPKPTWRNFSYDELLAATDYFNSEKLIGKGGHAEVYRGCLPDGRVVAVKKITKKGKNDEDRVGDFLSELGIIAHINHPNAAKLIGFSVDGGLHLVLQFLPHGSLASVLHGSTESLEWNVRFKVALGVAEGLQYLHCGCQRRIIHRDITASNILLTQDYEPQISDFGLAKWLPDKWINHVVSPIEGTFGYMAPEYFMHGVVDEKTDVFAFGVLLLELITGRHAVDSCRQSLVMWAKPLLEKNGVKEIADPRLGDAYEIGEMKRAILTASSCLHHLPSSRPDMNRVVHLLKGEDGVVEVKQKSMGGRPILLDVCDLEEYTCTTYLNDLNRHMQLVME